VAALLYKKMLKKILKLSIMLATVTAFFCYVFDVVMGTLVHSRKEVVVPNIVGKSLYDALEKLSKTGFAVKKVGEEFSQKLAAGTILRQIPSAGMTVREGRIINVTVSQGEDISVVPNLVGQSFRSADITLKYLGLVVGKVSQKCSISSEKGVVISQDIVAGKVVNKGSIINIEISNGHSSDKIIFMPNFINKNLREAMVWAAQNGIAVSVIKTDKSFLGYETDTVVTQYPEADTDITDAKSINLYVSISS
jgi:serine/threonine-protein kinase